MRTWQDNADEFHALSIQGKDFRLAILVACSVRKATNQHDAVAIATAGKCSARQFAERAGTEASRILRHLETWEHLAAKGQVPPASELSPEMVNEVRGSFVVPPAEWDEARLTDRPPALYHSSPYPDNPYEIACARYMSLKSVVSAMAEDAPLLSGEQARHMADVLADLREQLDFVIIAYGVQVSP